jgi:uncharacterized protein YndB with AHSA1/START domain
MGDKKELDIERVFNAPLERVWQTWTDPGKVAKWWGPNGTSSVKCIWEAKAGGKTQTIVKAGDSYGPAAGMEWESSGEFKEVVPHKKLTFTNDPILNGETVAEHLVTAEFEEQADKTLVKVHIQITTTKDTQEAQGALDGIPMGWNQQLDKLDKLLS